MDVDNSAPPILRALQSTVVLAFAVPALVLAGLMGWSRLTGAAGDVVTPPQALGGFVFSTGDRPTTSTACSSLTTGELAAYLATTPCAELTARQYTATADGTGKTVTVHVTWLRMPDEAGAEHLHQLTADRANGSTQPVIMGVLFAAEHAVARTGTTVTIVRAGTRIGLPAPDDVVRQAAAAALGLTP